MLFQKENARRGRFRFLVLRDLQHFHRAGFGADAAGDTLGGVGHLRLEDQHAERAGFLALAATDAELLIDHVHTRLGVLRNCAMLAGLCALAALDAGHRAHLAVTLHNLDAGLIRVKFLIKRVGAGADTFEARHTLRIFFHGQFFHFASPLQFCRFVPFIIQSVSR